MDAWNPDLLVMTDALTVTVIFDGQVARSNRQLWLVETSDGLSNLY